MGNEQAERFASIRSLIDEAQQTLNTMSQWTNSDLSNVKNDSSQQAECLQRLQQCAGSVVQAATQVSELARHARSFQAQAHQRHSGDTPR